MINPYSYIYISTIDKHLDGLITHQERLEEIKKCKSDKTKREKTSVWNLLQLVLEEQLNLDINSLNLTKNENSKWVCEDLYISFSHSKDLIMVGVSSHPIGVDIQEFRPIENPKTLAKLASIDFCEEKDSVEYLIEEWSKKEAIFKKKNLKNFIGSKIKVDNFTKTIFNNYNYNNATYVAVVSQNIDIKQNVKILI